MMPSPLVSTILPVPWLTALIQVGERDHAVAVDVRQVGEHARGDLGLIDPDVVVQVGMVVVDAGVDVGDDHLIRAGGDVPGRGSIDAPGAVDCHWLPFV